MRVSVLLLLMLFSLISTRTYCQDYNVPANYELKAKEDYSKYEKDVIDAANWLVAIPLNEQQDKRKEVSRFIMQWVSGSPTVNVEIVPIIMDFEKKNKGMLFIYMASAAKYVLENNYSKDVRAKQKAALHDLVKVYQSGKGIDKDKKMEKLIKADSDGKLDEWIDDNIKVQS